MAERRGQVELQQVTKRFGDVLAVERLELDVRGGELLAVLGPSGCGKTTTLRMLAGFERPDAGRVLLDGADVTDLPPHRRNLNTVFQQYALFPHMTVAENVAFGLRQHGVSGDERTRRLAEGLEMVKLGAYGARRPAELSGGQQQRVALARALVNRPAVLLLDEPLGALDRGLREQMQVELKTLQATIGTTFVYVTHDQDEALSMADRVAVMNRGRIVQLDTPEAVYDLPATGFVAGFVGRQNFLDGQVQADGVLATTVGPVAGRWVGDEPAAGTAGRAAIRPEVVELTDDRPVEGGGLEATVVGCSVIGDVVQVVIRLDSGDEIVARRSRDGRPRLVRGSTVWCRWPREQVLLYRDETSEDS